MKRLGSAAAGWIIAGTAALALAAAAFVLFYPGLTTSGYLEYRIALKQLGSSGVPVEALGGYGEPVTRHAFARLVNAAFGLTRTSGIAFADDVAEDAAREIDRAVTQGYLGLVDGRADPDAAVTRQQAALALASLFSLRGGDPVELADGDDVDEDARAAVFAVAGRELLTVRSGLFRPRDPLTVSETVLMLRKAVGVSFAAAGAYTSGSGNTIRGNATLSAGGVALCDTTVTGDVYITEGAGEGEITLDHVAVEGRILIAGGSGVLLSDVTCGQVIIRVPIGGPVRVAAMGGTTLSAVLIQSDARLEETGLTGEGFADVTLEENGLSLELSGALNSLEILGANAEVMLSEGASARSVVVWTRACLRGAGEVGWLIVHDGPVACDIIPGMADILTTRAVTLADYRFFGERITVAGSDLAAVLADAGTLAIGYREGDGAGGVTGDVSLPVSGGSGSSVAWTSSDPRAVTADGVVTRADYPLGDTQVVLTAVVSSGNVSRTLTYPLTVLQKEITPQQSVDEDVAAIEIRFVAGDSAAGIIHDLTLPTSGSNGTAITWHSSHPGVLDAAGKVNRPTKGNRSVTLTATVTKEGAIANREFTIVVREIVAYTDKEMLQEDKDSLRITYAPGDSSASVTQSLLLPGWGVNGSAVTWKSSQSSVVAADGTVSRPSALSGDQTVTLTATLTLGDLKTTKTFTVTVAALEPEPTATPTAAPTATPAP